MKSLTRHFPTNTLGRDFVVGDIHGCASLFLDLLETIQFNPEVDRMFSVGDLADRGPESSEAMNLLYEPWFFPVRGNHEDILTQVVHSMADQSWWDRNGGSWSKEVDQKLLLEFSAKIGELPLAIVVGEGDTKFNVIHAEYFGGQENLEAGDFGRPCAEQLMWGRRMYTMWKNTGQIPPQTLVKTYCGHTIVPEVLEIASQVFIDTGAFMPVFGYEGCLTIVEPKTEHMWQKSL